VAKKLQLLHDMVPDARVVGVLVNPANPGAESDAREAQEAARARGLQVQVLNVSNEGEIDAAFEALTQRKAGALILQGDPFLTRQINQLIALASRHALPAIYFLRSHVEAGGLMSYAPSIIDLYREAAVYAGRILKGEKPGDLPVQLAAKLELVINRKTADALGLTIPAQMYILADEVIE
jgi:putative tryptophan/tyrosine transport system substrate-binding protein